VGQIAAFRRNVQACSAFCGLFAYAADLRHIHGVKVGIRELFNWTAENLSLGCSGCDAFLMEANGAIRAPGTRA
jgi:hypothetical protein